MPNQDALNRAIDATFLALNGLNETALRKTCSDTGHSAITALMGDVPNQFARFPVSLVNGHRAAVRGIVSHEDSHDPLWLSFERSGDSWQCTGTLPSRDAAQSWLATAPAASDDAPSHVFVALCEAATRHDAPAVRELTHTAWRDAQASPERWVKALPLSMPAELVEAPRQCGRRSVALLRCGSVTQWVIAEHTAARWQLLAVVDEPAARHFLRDLSSDPIVWERLGSEPAVLALARNALAVVGTDAAAPQGADLTAWAMLIEPAPAGLVVELGAVKAVPSLGRAAAQLRFVDATDPEWTDDERWAYFSLTSAGWTLQHCQSSGGVSPLLAELDLPWPSDAEGPNDDLRSSMSDLFDTLKSSSDGTSGIDSDVLKGLFGGFAKAVKEQAQRAANASDPDVVDLATERAKRGKTAPVDLESDLGQVIKDAFSGFVARSDDGSGKVNVDADFLKDRAPDIATTLFGALAKALVPQTVSVDVPTDVLKDDLDPDATTGTNSSGQKTVKLDLDLSSLLGKLFEARPTKDDE